MTAFSAKSQQVTTWNPTDYRRFASERSAPFEDLIGLVRVRPNARVIDLGCGTGELTARLRDAVPGADILGIDSSQQMLERAAEHVRPGVRFAQATVEETVGRFDLIFSNAALHWVADHSALFARLFAMLEPGGQLVVQMPARRRPAAYSSILDVARSEPHRTALGGFEAPWPVLAIEEYAELLGTLGARDVTALDKVYLHLLRDADALAEWQAGTALLPYKQRLSPDAYREFESELRARLRERWPAGPVRFAFRRSIIAATRPA